MAQAGSRVAIRVVSPRASPAVNPGANLGGRNPVASPAVNPVASNPGGSNPAVNKSRRCPRAATNNPDVIRKKAPAGAFFLRALRRNGLRGTTAEARKSA